MVHMTVLTDYGFKLKNKLHFIMSVTYRLLSADLRMEDNNLLFSGVVIN